MSRNRQQDADMDRLLGAALRAESRLGGGDCPEPADLAAFVERTLPAAEQARLEAHLAGCDRCQEVLAAIVELPSSPGASGREAGRAGTWLDWFTGRPLRWLVPVSAAATALFVYLMVPPAYQTETPVFDAVPQVARPTVQPSVGGGGSEEAESKAAGAPRREEPAAARPAETAPATLREAPRERSAAPKPVPAAPKVESRAPAELLPSQPMPSAPIATAVPPPPPSAGKALAAEPPTPGRGMAGGVAGGVVGGLPEAPPAVAGEAARSQVRPAAAADQRAPAFAVSKTLPPTMIAVAGDARTQWRIDAAGRIFRSTNAGATWQPQVSGTSVGLVHGSAPSATTCWVVGRAGTVLVTTDGERWQRRAFPERVDLVGVEAVDASKAVVTARDGRRFSTTDGGATWIDLR